MGHMHRGDHGDSITSIKEIIKVLIHSLKIIPENTKKRDNQKAEDAKPLCIFTDFQK